MVIRTFLLPNLHLKKRCHLQVPNTWYPPLTYLAKEPLGSKPRSKGSRFRSFFLYLFLATGVTYGGGVYLSLKSDAFHDFFTEYFPFGEELVLYLEERDYYRRFPHASKTDRRSPGPDVPGKVTIPGKSGISSKVSGEDSLPPAKGPHMSAVKMVDEDVANKAEVKGSRAKPEDKTAAVKKAKADKAEGDKNKAKAQAVEQQKQQSTVGATEVTAADEPVVQELVKVFNDLFTVIDAGDKSGNYSAPLARAKEEVQKIGDRIVTIRNDAHDSAQEEIKQAHTTFDESARELIRRFEEIRTSDAAQYREEYEAEREKLVRSYQGKVQTELDKADELAEQRLRNELVEQAIELDRKYLHSIEDLVEKEREGRLSKLSELTNDVGELERLLGAWQEVVNTNLKTQQLQVAVDAVRTVLERSDLPRPFIRELVAVKELAAEDPVVEAAVASINPTSYQRGIPSTSQLVDRFRRVAAEVRKASLLPENAGIASHAASFVLSKVAFKKDGLANGDDVESVLTRVESLLEEGNIDAAAREMNTLQGWAKILSKDWLGDVRKVLEVRQALDVSMLLLVDPTTVLSGLPLGYRD